MSSDPAPSDCTPSQQPQPDPDELSIIGSDAQAFRSLAAIAPGLSEAELKVAIHLAAIRDPATDTAKASSRDLAQATRLSRPSVQSALDTLTRRCLIATRTGSGALASRYRLNFLQTTPLSSGQKFWPLAQTNLDLQPSERPEILATSRTTAPPSISITSDSILDRVLTARANQWPAPALDLVRRSAYKWLLLQRGMHNAQPPDLTLAAQLATAAGGCGTAETWIRDHLTDRQAENCGYLVSWMLQQLHGIAPPTIKRRRAELRAVAKTAAATAAAIPDAPAPDTQEFTEDLLRQATAGVKKLR